MERENTVKQFLNEVFGEVRVVSKEEQIWFCASDIAKALGDRDANKITRILEDEDRSTHNVGTAFGIKEMTFISESGLYEVILSKKPKSQEKREHILQFKKWITKEVIPSIRKNDGYIDKQEELSPEELMAKALLVAQQVIDEKERKIKEQEEVVVEQGTVIDILSEKHTTIHGTREKVNMIIRKISAKEYSNAFWKCWNEFYKVLRYEHHIGNKIKDMSEDQLMIAYKTALSWANKLEIEVKEALN